MNTGYKYSTIFAGYIFIFLNFWCTISPAVAGGTPDSLGKQQNISESPEISIREFVISSTGIGSAELGMTIGELKRRLGKGYKFKELSLFMVDFDAIAVVKGTEHLFYVIFQAGEALSDAKPIRSLITENPKFKTVEGIGPKTLLADAAKVYGVPTLSYHTENEHREFVYFEKTPHANIIFETGNGENDPAGIYPVKTEEYNETQSFRTDAVIKSVMVIDRNAKNQTP